MQKTPKIYLLQGSSPYENMAIEEALFLSLKDRDAPENILLLYQNDPCIILGRYQNP